MDEYLKIFNKYCDNFSSRSIHKPYKISILCAHYNNHKYLPDFIKSLQWQTYPNWEAIIVDDCSSQGDPAPLIEAANDSRISYFRQKQNLGACAARNAAFAHAKGEFVICLDPDDIMHPEMFAALASQCISGAHQILMFDYIYFGHRSGICRTRLSPLKALLNQQWIPGVSMLNAQIYGSVGGWDTNPVLRHGNQDWEFWLNVWEQYPNIIVTHVPVPLMLYRQHQASTSSRRLPYDHETRKYILKKHRELFDGHGAAEGFLATGYAIAAAYRLFSGNILGAANIIREGCQACPSHLLIKRLLEQSKAALLNTAVGANIHPYLRKLKRLLTGA